MDGHIVLASIPYFIYRLYKKHPVFLWCLVVVVIGGGSLWMNITDGDPAQEHNCFKRLARPSLAFDARVSEDVIPYVVGSLDLKPGYEEWVVKRFRMGHPERAFKSEEAPPSPKERRAVLEALRNLEGIHEDCEHRDTDSLPFPQRPSDREIQCVGELLDDIELGTWFGAKPSEEDSETVRECAPIVQKAVQRTWPGRCHKIRDSREIKAVSLQLHGCNIDDN